MKSFFCIVLQIVFLTICSNALLLAQSGEDPHRNY